MEMGKAQKHKKKQYTQRPYERVFPGGKQIGEN